MDHNDPHNHSQGPTANTATVHGTRFELETAAFGGFLLVLRPV
jgi:hypothetical protein